MQKITGNVGYRILLRSRLRKRGGYAVASFTRNLHFSNSSGPKFNESSTAAPKHDHGQSASMEEWVQSCFSSDESVPAFAVCGNNLTVYTQPKDFYQTLKTKASQAKKRIVLSSLYIGTGKLEKELVDTIHERARELTEQNKDFQIHILLDHARGSRGKNNSKTMLLPLLKECTKNVRISFYHPPTLRGLLYALIPERFNETISAMHIKAYIFDDTLVMSGANLSNDYFTNRQDRCIVFEDCKELCDYFHDLVNTVSSFSLELAPDNNVRVSSGFPEHPYKGSKKGYIGAVRDRMHQFIQKYSHTRSRTDTLFSTMTDNIAVKTTTASKNYSDQDTKESAQSSREKLLAIGRQEKDTTKYKDTLVIPALQMFSYGIRQDEYFTACLLEKAPAKSSIFLATAYFNVTRKHWNEILASKCRNFDIVMAHPKANGFYEAPGPAGGIPHAYTLIAKQCYKDIVRFKQHDRIKFWEYEKPGWTFHGKGIWGHLLESHVPQITMIGSSNFGNRSVYRDLETQLTIFTKNEKLTRQLDGEKRNILDSCDKVDSSTYKDPKRKVPLWVFIIRTFMRTFF